MDASWTVVRFRWSTTSVVTTSSFWFHAPIEQNHDERFGWQAYLGGHAVGRTHGPALVRLDEATAIARFHAVIAGNRRRGAIR
jgi:hypothetical protein